MKTKLLYLGVMLPALWISFQAAAQGPVLSETHSAKLKTLSKTLRERDVLHRRDAHARAQRLGIPIRRELPNGRVLELQRWAPGSPPVFYITYNNDAADTVSTDEVWPSGSSGLNLDGSGMTMAEWDGGAIFADHPDFTGRLTQVDGATEVSGHSTHVAGTLIGSGAGLLPESRGMAYAALLDAYDWNSDTAEMAGAAATGQLISNHSYGIAAGWLFFGEAAPNGWWWIGGSDPADIEDSNFGYYDSESQLWDQVAFDAPYYLIVKAAGNDRSDFGPAPGEEYTVIDQDGNKLFTSTLPRLADCAPAGYDCLPTHSVAKNILTVGAVDDLPGGYSQLGGPGAVSMADFSGWGPTDDGRIKPDLVGNGILLLSAWPDFPYYALAAGTSMSTPNVTGSLLLLQQHYQNLHGEGMFMRASTLKALAIHTADEAGSEPGPDYSFGWGLLNTRTAANVISEEGNDHRIIEGTLSNGSVQTRLINVLQPGATLTATLVWADPAGIPPAPSLDPPDLMLVNDLDLRITRGGNTWLPWVLDPANPAVAATRGDNFRDNVEQVDVFSASAGAHIIEVRHKGTLLDSLPQNYSLIISVTPPPPTQSDFLIDEDFSGGMPGDWGVDTQTGVSWTIRTPVVSNLRYDNRTGGTGQFAMVDNNFVNVTVTSLRTPVVDLSTAEAVILRFSSYFSLDTAESINVDASIDGGANWSTVWSWQGFNPLPTRYVLDLTSAIGGETEAVLRFRFDSESVNDPQGDLWQIDDVELEAFSGSSQQGDPPGQASNPQPGDGAAITLLDTDLSWAAGTSATHHDVYFGTNNPPGDGDYRGTVVDTTFDPGPLAPQTTYYWRINEAGNDGFTFGMNWMFTTQDEPAEIIHSDGFEPAGN